MDAWARWGVGQEFDGLGIFVHGRISLTQFAQSLGALVIERHAIVVQGQGLGIIIYSQLQVPHICVGESAPKKEIRRAARVEVSINQQLNGPGIVGRSRVLLTLFMEGLAPSDVG